MLMLWLEFVRKNLGLMQWRFRGLRVILSSRCKRSALDDREVLHVRFNVVRVRKR